MRIRICRYILNKGGVIAIFFFFQKLLKFLSKCVDKLKNLLYYINIEKRKRKLTMAKKKKVITITFTPKRNTKKSPEDLQAHLNEMRRGASVTKNGKGFQRHQKHKKRDF